MPGRVVSESAEQLKSGEKTPNFSQKECLGSLLLSWAYEVD